MGDTSSHHGCFNAQTLWWLGWFRDMEQEFFQNHSTRSIFLIQVAFWSSIGGMIFRVKYLEAFRTRFPFRKMYTVNCRSSWCEALPFWLYTPIISHRIHNDIIHRNPSINPEKSSISVAETCWKLTHCGKNWGTFDILWPIKVHETSERSSPSERHVRGVQKNQTHSLRWYKDHQRSRHEYGMPWPLSYYRGYVHGYVQNCTKI